MNKIIVFVISLNTNHMLFSHQHAIVKGFADHFDQVIAISPDVAFPELPPNISSLHWKWKPNHRYFSSINYFIRGIVLLQRNRDAKVVFIQADHISALLSPFCFLFRVRSYLWYAHGHKSRFLKFSRPFLTSIFTANFESCSINSSKLKIVGHYIDHVLFTPNGTTGPRNYSRDFFHLGRTDRSKRIPLIASAISQANSSERVINLYLLGAPSSIEERKSHDKVMSFLKIAYGNLNIIESGPINRKALPALLTSMGIFVHAFQGSLDKALLEATLMCNPVATVNIGYLKIFGPWSRSKSKDEKQFIIDEITAIQGHNLEKLSQELIRRRNLVLKNHTLESWLTKVTGLMKEE